LPSYYEDLITKYLFKRQLSLYRDKKEQEWKRLQLYLLL
jgi:cell division protein FtsL